MRLLKGFERAAVASGETRTQHFSLGPDELARWSAATRGGVQGETVFDVFIGGDSADALNANFEVTRD